jgi:hypothetical protein
MQNITADKLPIIETATKHHYSIVVGIAFAAENYEYSRSVTGTHDA